MNPQYNNQGQQQTTEQSQAQGNNPNQKRQPDYIAYHVQQNEQNGKGYFYQVGAAWKHKDNRGYDIQLDSMPVNGRVTLREQRQEHVQKMQNQRQDMQQNGQSMTQEQGRER